MEITYKHQCLVVLTLCVLLRFHLMHTTGEAVNEFASCCAIGATQDLLGNYNITSSQDNAPPSAQIHLMSVRKTSPSEKDNEYLANLKSPPEYSRYNGHVREVEIRESRNYIVHSGRYYVYFSVNFETGTTKSSSSITNQVHRTHRDIPFYSGSLLKIVSTACPFYKTIHRSGFTVAL
ncbi:unnamed protein product [Lymnaea stagnalis]|uniref:Uncharacterized protein n=1 Tax=Lymnaea stagnalis TaxID=6523 RepID=A0AAV2HIF0_LYMST